MRFRGRVVPNGITLSLAFGRKLLYHGHHSPGKLNAINSGGVGAGPHSMFKLHLHPSVGDLRDWDW